MFQIQKKMKKNYHILNLKLVLDKKEENLDTPKWDWN
jgi:hypothetical protein